MSVSTNSMSIDPSAPQHGFWRSLEELAATDEFREQCSREFKSPLPTLDEVDRRKFFGVMAASLAMASAAGCARQPAEQIVPYVKAPEELVPGKPLYYATAMTRGGYALGLLVESHMGRPTKIEGNPEHSASLGATDVFAQASILGLYDPDRSQTIMHRGAIQTWDSFLTTMARERESWKGSQGKGLRILTETITSPTLAAQLEALLEELPEARWHQYEPASLDNVREGARLAFGQILEPVYHFERADIVLSLDADFLTALPGSVRYARDFIDRRRVVSDSSAMNRLYVVESTPTLTGAAADHRLPLRPSQILPLAQLIAAKLGLEIQNAPQNVPGIPDQWLTALVGDLQAAGQRGLVIAGPGQPPEVHALVNAINARLNVIGNTVEWIEPVAAGAENQLQSLQQLVSDMQAGAVDTLVILGGNPIYSSPGVLGFEQSLNKVRLRVHLSEAYDETSFLCDWHIPAAHYLESWSDARAYNGVTTLVQPLITPLYRGKTAHEIVAVLQGQAAKSSYELLQAHWQRELGDDFGRAWRKALHDGIVGEESIPTDLGRSTAQSYEGQSQSGDIEIEFRPDPTTWDGRYANNAWLQECPKPLTKLTWDNVAQISPASAAQRQLTNGDVVRISIGERSITAPVWITPGQPDNCVSLTFGYGRTRAGQVGTGIGYNAYAIRPAEAAWFASGTLEKTSRRYPLSATQDHHSMEGRDIVRVTTLERYQERPDHLSDGKHSPDHLPSLLPEDDNRSDNAWGMVIDQTACIGCNACVVACQAENNIPVVGKEQVAVGREMHWLRIDRYYHGPKDDPLANPETYFQPMMCVHCEKAPCEIVCPVAATVHDSEGTSNMVYNRCVGTRYCSNNCPYKVRRFNFLQYSDETTESLKLLRNPDVTVRSRGVMEKCSYCIQRLNLARIDAKKENRMVDEGEVQTACQQACPTQAIVFSNLNAKGARAAELKKSPLNYGVLAELNTQPRTTFLARVVNSHPDLPEPTAVKQNAGQQDKAHS